MKPVPQPQISPERFTWEKYCSQTGFTLFDVFIKPYCGVPGSESEIAFKLGVEVVGYCPANRLQIRPRNNGSAVLVRFTDTGEETWLHYDTDPE